MESKNSSWAFHFPGGDNKTCLDRSSVPKAPRILTWSPVTIATIQGDIALPCNAVGNPMPEIYWKNQDNVNVVNDPRVQVSWVNFKH